MSDERLRTLERAWRESGETQAHAAWLAARLRAQLISEKAIRAAAILGSPGALLAIESEGLGIVGESTERAPSRVFMALACLDQREWLVAVVAVYQLFTPLRNTRALDPLEEALAKGDEIEIGVVAQGTHLSSGPGAIRALLRRIYALAAEQDEDAAWDLAQALITHASRFPVPAIQGTAVGWEEVVEATAKVLIPRLVG